MLIKRMLSFGLALFLLLFLLPVPATAVEPVPYAAIVTASDFQGGAKAFKQFGSILRQIKKAYPITPDAYLFGGDYGEANGVDLSKAVPRVWEQVSKINPKSQRQDMICIQGNHDTADPSGAYLNSTGLYEFPHFWVYAINEDAYCARQAGQEDYPQAARSLAREVNTALLPLVEQGDCRPVFIATHVPLHHSSRYDYGDTLYSAYLFDVLNELGKDLDIIFLFGHNHSYVYDDYIGGAVNYLPRGSRIRIPVPSPEARGEDGYSLELLNFTYMNYGYVGYSRNSDTLTSTSAITAGLITLEAGTITVSRYTEEGLHSLQTIQRLRPRSDLMIYVPSSPTVLPERGRRLSLWYPRFLLLQS